VIRASAAAVVVVLLAVATATATAAPASATTPPPTADGTPIDLPDTPAEITVPASWTPTPIPEVAARPVAAYESPAGARVVITRAGAHNPEAWSERRRTKYADQVEAGVTAATEGYQRKRRAIQKVNGVPVMDLELSRVVGGKREDVVLRFVFFRTYTLTVAAVAPGKDRAAVAAIVKSFGPPKGYDP
jgi:hypothetical protein